MPLRIVVDASAGVQTLQLYLDDRLNRTYSISTARLGIGFRRGSNRTPVGLHRISEKVGDGAPPGTVFDGLTQTRRIEDNLVDNRTALMTSRILRLEGLERCNLTSAGRGIFIHGTSREAWLGQRDSHGCIRMSNTDVIDLFGRVEVGTVVEIISDDCRGVDRNCQCVTVVPT